MESQYLNNDGEEWHLTEQELDHLKKFIIPKTLLNPVIIMIWGSYEAGMLRALKYATEKTKKAWNQKWKPYTVSSTLSIFRQIGIHLAVNNKDIADLGYLATTRHIICHYNGILGDYSFAQQAVPAKDEYMAWLISGRCMKEKHEFIVAEECYLKSSLALVQRIIEQAFQCLDDL